MYQINYCKVQSVLGTAVIILQEDIYRKEATISFQIFIPNQNIPIVVDRSQIFLITRVSMIFTLYYITNNPFHIKNVLCQLVQYLVINTKHKI